MNAENEITVKMKNVIQELITYEPELDYKLDLLTAIAITTRSPEVTRATEEIRFEISSSANQGLERKAGGPKVRQSERSEDSDVLHQETSVSNTSAAFDYCTGLAL